MAGAVAQVDTSLCRPSAVDLGVSCNRERRKTYRSDYRNVARLWRTRLSLGRALSWCIASAPPSSTVSPATLSLYAAVIVLPPLRAYAQLEVSPLLASHCVPSLYEDLFVLLSLCGCVLEFDRHMLDYPCSQKASPWTDVQCVSLPLNLGDCPCSYRTCYSAVYDHGTKEDMKRRRRGPRGAAFFHLNDGNLLHMEEQQASSGSAARTGGLEDPESSVANQTPDDSGTREAPAHCVGDYEDVALSSDSGRDGCRSDDSEFSFEGDRDRGGFVSRREFVCFGYLYGRARVTLRQYDIMRDAENSFDPTEKWPSRWRVRKLREHMLKSAIPLRRETTTRQLLVGKGKAMRKLPSVEVSYITFSEHIVGSRAHRISAASHCTSAAFRRPSHFRKLCTTGLQMSSYVSLDAWILCKARSSV